VKVTVAEIVALLLLTTLGLSVAVALLAISAGSRFQQIESRVTILEKWEPPK
jgi:hypothetical protein